VFCIHYSSTYNWPIEITFIGKLVMWRSETRLKVLQIHLHQPRVTIHLHSLGDVSYNFVIPAHCHQLDFFSVMSLIMISFSANQHMVLISSCQNMYTVNWKHLICPKKLLCSFVHHSSLNLFILCSHFSYKTHVFVTYPLIGCNYCGLHPVKAVTMVTT
jgi:hypothetical protein